jgi:hypothetical protein
VARLQGDTPLESGARAYKLFCLTVLPFEYRVSFCRAVCAAWGRAGRQRATRLPKSMSQRPELTSSSLSANPAPLPGPAAVSKVERPLSSRSPQTEEPRRIPGWLQRAELFVRILLRLYVGLALCYAPWSHMFWDQNPLFVHFPTLSIYAANGAVRGIVSGLGLLNLWIAFREVFPRR